jgi:hypothetical protein
MLRSVNNKHIGSPFDDFLREEAIFGETQQAVRQLVQEIKVKNEESRRRQPEHGERGAEEARLQEQAIVKQIALYLLTCDLFVHHSTHQSFLRKVSPEQEFDGSSHVRLGKKSGALLLQLSAQPRLVSH